VLRYAALLLLFAATPTSVAQITPPPERGAVQTVALVADLSGASLRQVQIIRLLIRAADIIDGLYRRQVAPGGFYPEDMSDAEFAAWEDPAATDPYTRIVRDADGALQAVPYHAAWALELGQVARLLARAAEITRHEPLRHYLVLRARAFLTDDHARADAAWLALRDSDVDVLIGPFDTAADTRFGLKAAFSAHLLLRDWAWGARLAGLTVFLPRVQHTLPVSEAFKASVPQVDMKLAVYDLLYQAGHGAAQVGEGRAEVAADRQVRLQQGPRALQLRNVMHARFDALVAPVAAELLAPESRDAMRFEAFFLNTMLEEMAHALGVQRTIDDRQAVEAALGAQAPIIETAKAAVLSLWLVDWLQAHGELPDTTSSEHQAGFLAGLLHAIRFDSASAAGRARLLVFNYFRDWGAFRRDASTGTYRIDPVAMRAATESLAAQLLTLQGAGDEVGAAALVTELAGLRPELHEDLARLARAGVPTGLVFRQGENLLGL